jgi:sugar/nucleoside kinase (ribokinase family)
MNDSGSLFVLGSVVVACSATVAALPEPGESLRADAFKAEAGGKGLNLALGALRLGASVDGLFAVGNDLFADFARSAFVEAGLAPAMLRSYNAVTGAGIGFTDARGENCLAVYPERTSVSMLTLSAQSLRRCRLPIWCWRHLRSATSLSRKRSPSPGVPEPAPC